MGTKGRRDVPARLEGLRRRLERWRRTRKVRGRIPEPLWASAVKLAGTHGIHRTAKFLRIDYYALKKRTEGASAAIAGKTPAEVARSQFAEVARPQFLELPAVAWSGSGECMLELEDAGGAKLRVHLKGFEAPDLTALVGSFWQVES